MQIPCLMKNSPSLNQMESLHSPFLSSRRLLVTSPSLFSFSCPSSPFPIRRQSSRHRKIFVVQIPSKTLACPPKSKPPPNTLLPLDLARNSLSILIFSISLTFLPFPPIISFAIAAPIATATQTRTRKEHEFAGYTDKLLASVSLLLEKIEIVKASKGGMKEVTLALKEVKRKRKEIQGELLERLNSEPPLLPYFFM